MHSRASPGGHGGAPRGFTLIELTVSLAIIAVLLSAAIVSIGAITGARAKAAAGELSGVIRSLYDTASLKGHTCRLVFQLPKDKDDSGARYWAECAPGDITTSRDRDQALRDANQKAEDAARMARQGLRPETDHESEEDLEAQVKAKVDAQVRYSKFTSPEIQPRELAGVKISVWTQHQEQPVTTGRAFLYFFPQGYTERAYVFLTQGHNTWTITVSPLTGKTRVVGKRLEVPTS